MDAVIIYQNGQDLRHRDASLRDMRGGPAKIIAYVNGALYAVDREQDARIAIPVSRWKLAEIGLACFLAALKGKGAAPRPLEPVPLTEPPPEALPEPPPKAIDRESPEEEWERLMKEMRDLSGQ
jgi:hypothetical protein